MVFLKKVWHKVNDGYQSKNGNAQQYDSMSVQHETIMIFKYS